MGLKQIYIVFISIIHSFLLHDCHAVNSLLQLPIGVDDGVTQYLTGQDILELRKTNKKNLVRYQSAQALERIQSMNHFYKKYFGFKTDLDRLIYISSPENRINLKMSKASIDPLLRKPAELLAKVSTSQKWGSDPKYSELAGHAYVAVAMKNDLEHIKSLKKLFPKGISPGLGFLADGLIANRDVKPEVFKLLYDLGVFDFRNWEYLFEAISRDREDLVSLFVQLGSWAGHYPKGVGLNAFGQAFRCYKAEQDRNGDPKVSCIKALIQAA